MFVLAYAFLITYQAYYLLEIAIPTGVALIGLGYSLWRSQRTPAARPVTSPVSSRPEPAGAR